MNLYLKCRLILTFIGFRSELYFYEPMVFYLKEFRNPEIYNREHHSKKFYATKIIISATVLRKRPGNDQTYITLLVTTF
jgi:hypothetical protein